MHNRRSRPTLVAGTLIGILAATAAIMLPGAKGNAAGKKASDNRLFELRIYTTNKGKLDALHSRFRDHTNRLFEKHGMTLVGYWTPTEGDEAANTLVYILAHPDREARNAAWSAFIADPEWVKAYADSVKDGRLVKKVESKFLAPTDYSPMK